jgi:hypothetical protein
MSTNLEHVSNEHQPVSDVGLDKKLNIVTASVPTTLPIFTIDLRPLLQPHMDLAKQAIFRLRQTHPVSPESNVYATYMSPWKSHLLAPELKPLCDSVITIAKMVSHQVLSANLDTLNMDLIVSDCWGIIYENGSYTRVHNHFPAEYGCVIYLEADQEAAPIIFAGTHQIQPQAGSLVLFPGVLNHEVPKNAGKRIVLALNLIKIQKQ